MKLHVKALIAVSALIFISLGFIGLFLPFLQGILFLLIGVYLLSLVSPAFKKWFDGHLTRFPWIRKHYDHHYDTVSRWMNRVGKQ